MLRVVGIWESYSWPGPLLEKDPKIRKNNSDEQFRQFLSCQTHPVLLHRECNTYLNRKVIFLMEFSPKVAPGLKLHVFSRNRREREASALTRTRIWHAHACAFVGWPLLGPNQCCVSGSRRTKITHKNRKSSKILIFDLLDVLFWGLTAFPVAWISKLQFLIKKGKFFSC